MDKPAYEYYKPSNNDVLTSMDLFFECDEQTRMFGVLEEAYVLASERSLIPNSFNVDPYKSFEMSLMKICTSITSGKFREFAWERYHEILFMYNRNYVDKFHDGVKRGIVKPL